jgi:hypothetical protein
MARTWLFDQEPDCEAKTDCFVVEKDFPILKVVHHKADGHWSFLSNATKKSDDTRIISMEAAINLDETLLTLSCLSPGCTATRERIGGRWLIEKRD